MRAPWPRGVCRGSVARGTGCGRCSACLFEEESLRSQATPRPLPKPLDVEAPPPYASIPLFVAMLVVVAVLIALAYATRG